VTGPRKTATVITEPSAVRTVDRTTRGFGFGLGVGLGEGEGAALTRDGAEAVPEAAALAASVPLVPPVPLVPLA
jgi:hypothetical protein